MDEERRKRMRSTTLDQLEEGRYINFPMLERVDQSEGDEEVSSEATTASASGEDFDYSDEDFFYAGPNSGQHFLGDNGNSDQEIGEDDIDPDELSYEANRMKQELIALGERVGVESRGLAADEIDIYLNPIICNSTSTLHIDRCVICQVEYEVGENLVALHCDHLYHKDCISKWLQINKICPICNNEVSFQVMENKIKTDS